MQQKQWWRSDYRTMREAIERIKADNGLWEGTMAWVNAPGTYWVNWFLFNGNSFSLNSIYFEKDDGIVSSAHALIVAGAVHEWVKTQLMPNLSVEIALLSTAATDMTTETSFTRTVFSFGGFPGSQGPMLPIVCGKRLFFRTPFTGRSFRGYNTIPGVPKSVQANDFLSSLFCDALVDAYELLPGVASSVGCTWVVCSRHADGADRAVALNTPITSVDYAHLLVDFWEQRKPGAHS